MALEHINTALTYKTGKSSLKLLLLCIANLANAVDGSFYPSIDYLVERTEQNRKTIISGLQELERQGVIKDTGRRTGATNQIIVYQFCLNDTENGTVPETEQYQKVPAKSTKNGRKESQKRYTDTVEETVAIETVAITPLPPKEKTDAVSDVFDHWKQTMRSPRSRLDDKRKRLISTWLRTYTADELKQAITGCSYTPHNMGDNPRNEKYNSIELILRDASHIERFMHNAENPPVRKADDILNRIRTPVEEAVCIDITPNKETQCLKIL